MTCRSSRVARRCRPPVPAAPAHLRGRSEGADTARPLLKLGNRFDGAISGDGQVLGCYVHGLFAADPFRHAFLHSLKARAASGVAYETGVEQALDDLAAHLERHADLDRILAMARAR